RNRKNLRRATALLAEAGWRVEAGKLVDPNGAPFTFEVLLRQGDSGNQTVFDIYTPALERLGISVTVSSVDDAQYTARASEYDFDMTTFRRDLSLSPGNEQRLYWGRAGVTTPGTRNLMGADSAAIEAMIDAMLASETRQDFTAAVRALDRVLTSGRYVIPIWQYGVGRIAHARQLRFPDTLPIYGDRPGFMPEVWWWQD
ncbi:MAG: ABC transporter substrate-binding protein, partial [Sedimentitalea sp.]